MAQRCVEGREANALSVRTAGRRSRSSWRGRGRSGSSRRGTVETGAGSPAIACPGLTCDAATHNQVAGCNKKGGRAEPSVISTKAGNCRAVPGALPLPACGITCLPHNSPHSPPAGWPLDQLRWLVVHSALHAPSALDPTLIRPAKNPLGPKRWRPRIVASLVTDRFSATWRGGECGHGQGTFGLSW